MDIDIIHLILHSKIDFNIEQYNLKYKNVVFEKWVGPFDGVTKTDKLNKIIEESTENYIMTADVDEFQIWDSPVKDFLKTSDFRWGLLQDRESKNKKLTDVTSEPLEIQFPLITKRTIWDDLHKPCIFPSKDRLLTPHHLRDNTNNMKNIILINHYRWISGRLEKTKERKERYIYLNEIGHNFRNSPWKRIPNWEGDYIVNSYKPKTLL